MRLLIIAVIILFSTIGLAAQGKFSTKTGIITFEASVPSFEEVKAVNSDVGAIVNTDTGEFAALALIKGFRFKVALMEEHFNENYMESSEYPKAVFKGRIVNFDPAVLTNKAKTMQLAGSLSIREISQSTDIPITVAKVDGKIKITGSFTINPGDFDIKIPSIVRNKIAERVDVFVEFNLIGNE